MPEKSPLERQIEFSLLPAALLAAIFILFSFMSPNRWWGINHAAYLPDYAGIVYAALLLLIFLPPVRKLLLIVIEYIAKIPARVGYPAAVMAGLVVFVVFQISVHSLGDSYVRASEISKGKIYLPTEFFDFLLHALVYRALNIFGRFEALAAIAITSIIIGAGFIVMLLNRSPFHGWKKGLFVLTVLSFGCSQLFFGYVESYTLLYLFAVWYLLLIFREDSGQASWTAVTITYLMAGLAHQAGFIILVASYWYLTLRKFRHDPARGGKIVLYLALSLLPFLIPRILNFVTGYEELRSLTSYFLPLTGDTYGVLTPLHLFDVLNLLILVAPVGIILLPGLIPVLVKSGEKVLALALIVPALLFIFLFNSDLTLVRDWDLFSVPVATMILPLILLFFREVPKDQRMVRLLVPVIFASLIFMTAWITLNSNTTGHLARAEHVIDHAVKGQRYGYENLAHHYDRERQHEDEVRVLLKIKEEDRNSRVYGQISQALWVLGRVDEAYEYAIKGVSMPRPKQIAAFMAGLTSLDKGLYLDAIRFFRALVKLDPRDRIVLSRLGDALAKVDSLNAATEIFKHMLSLDKNDPDIYFGLAALYYRQKDYRNAEQYCRQGLILKPNDANAQKLLQIVQELKPGQNGNGK